jgi:hypothetical protein
MFEPKVIKNIFDEPFFEYIKNYFINHPQIKNIPYDNYGSKRLDSFDDIVILECLNKLTDFAREKFGQKDIVPTYGVFAEYSGINAQLDDHLDVGPCTYTLDIGLYHNTPWNLFIENKESFPDPEINKVGILLLHWVNPDHPWLKYSPEVQKLIKKRTSVK